MVREICTNPKYEMETQKRLTLAVRVGLSVQTEGILVAPTEGLQGIELHKNADGTDYISVLYAGPIRGAGGTSAALSVAFADLARKTLGIGTYKPTKSEIERYIEEVMLYHARKARLQYLPSEGDIRIILENCPICVDGVPTEDIELGVHRDVKRLDAAGREQMISNKIRGGVPLVLCEGIAQKAKSVLKHSQKAGLDWSWLDKIIKVDKAVKAGTLTRDEKKESVFLQELVAGRPVLAYPEHPGSFRLRYGRSRLTGIAAKGFSPATMYLLEEFIATGTQLKVEKPGKGCIATPVDSIEGPFVKLVSGEALRVNDMETARAVRRSIKKILAVGDMLVTYGDFKKTNTPLAPTSYVEEYWSAQLRAAGHEVDGSIPTFKKAYELSLKYGVPMHPRYIYDYSDLKNAEVASIARAILGAKVNSSGDGLFDVSSIEIPIEDNAVREAIERLCVCHFDNGASIVIKDGDAQSLAASLGFSKDGKLAIHGSALEKYDAGKDTLQLVNSLAPFKVMRRSTRIGARIGRPEKARERLMKPAPHVLFPIGEYGGKERSIFKAYMNEKRKFGNSMIEVELGRYRCTAGKEPVASPYCYVHNARAAIERVCKTCGRITQRDVCTTCNSKTLGYDFSKVNIVDLTDKAMARLKLQVLPKTLKGVKGLVSRDKIAEPIEKGILRGMHGISIFKDGTSRFDATDTPMTHFYPREVGVSVGKLNELGYTHDYLGNPLTEDTQLVELMHQDVVINARCADYLLRISRFVDDLLSKFYGIEPFYKLSDVTGLLGQYVVTLSPHTSCGVMGRVVGFTNAHVGFAHPYTVSARRRNCDGDEDTMMLLLDALINFSRKYLPVTIGGTMDAPLILTVNIVPEEVDDEVHAMEVVNGYGLDFYDKTQSSPSPSEVSIELVGSRLGKATIYKNVNFTHAASENAIADAPPQSVYTKLKTMQEKIDLQFRLMDRMSTIDKPDTARRLIISHFIPDLMGNLHSFSKQTFRCVACNAKYRRVPLVGVCTRCQGKLVLTISKGGIEKYLAIATDLANRYNLEPYIKQRIKLIRDEIETLFGGVGGGERPTKQFNLANYM